MDIKTIQTLVAIADHRSFQAAADALGMSISNVSLQVRGLEIDLDTRLFDRSSRPPQLTRAGIDFVQRCRDVLVHWNNLASGISTDPGQGVLKIGAVHTSVSGGVSTALGSLRQKNPGLFFQLHTNLTPNLIHELKKQNIDCAIITMPDQIGPEMQFIEIAREELGVIANRGADGKDYREVLELNPYIRFNKQATLAQSIDLELKKRSIHVNAAMEVTTLDAVASLVKNSLGVSIVPIGKNVPSLPQQIKILSFTSEPFHRTLGLIVRIDCPRMHLVDLLQEELSIAYRSGKDG
jgi:DNA-binding transcriptional LysR family regulator